MNLGPTLTRALLSMQDAEKRQERYVGYGQRPTFACLRGIRITQHEMNGLVNAGLVVVTTSRDVFGSRQWSAALTAEGRAYVPADVTVSV